jgi:hypothetical protein
LQIEIRAVVQDHSIGRFLSGGTNYFRGMKSLGWLEVPQVPWSQLGGAGSLKGPEMSPWVMGERSIIYNGGAYLLWWLRVI